MTSHCSPHRATVATCTRPKWLAALLCLVPSLLLAQVPAAPAAEPAAPTGDTIELSPFTVNPGADRGYQAQSSLSGSRLKSDLKDLATPVSVFTEQFMLDTAITNTDDLVKYMLSSEYDYSEDVPANQNRQTGGSGAPLRMRGLAGGDVTTNFFPVGLRTDTFSTERIEQARGPNAILFGVGNPGGVINTTTKRAKLNRNSGVVSGQIRSYDGTRVEGDYNQVIVQDKLAVRIAAVKTNLNSWRTRAFRDEDRYFGTAKWMITPKTELVGEVEKGHVERRNNRTYTALDGYTRWANAGRVISAVANTPAGIERHAAGTTPYLIFNEDTGQLVNYSAATRTTSPVGDASALLTDLSVLPQGSSLIGPGYGQSEDYLRRSAFLTHAFTSNLNVELAATRLDYKFVNNDTQQNAGNFLRVDPSPTTPTGAVNPNVGRAYLEDQAQHTVLERRYEGIRASASYRFDLGKYFGKHTLAGVSSYDYSKQTSIASREFVVSANAPSNILAANNRLPEQNNNRVWRRTYVDLNGPISAIGLSDWRVKSTSGLTDPVSGQTYQTAIIPFSAAAVPFTATKTNTYIGMLQSSFWNDRIHTIFGMSRDERTAYDSKMGRLAPTAGFTGGVLTPVKNPGGLDSTADNRTFSVVFNVTKWLGLTYSKAQNSGLPQVAPNAAAPDGSRTGLVPPRVKGRSEDMGFKLDLFDRRYFLSALYFQTASKDDFEFSTPVSSGDTNNIWNALDSYGVLDPLTNAPIQSPRDQLFGGTFASASQGYEVEFTANPIKTWRIFLNYTRTKTRRTDIGPEIVAYVNAQRDYWLQGDRARMYIPGRGNAPDLAPTARDGNGTVDTIQEQVDQFDANILSSIVFADGRQAAGQIPQRVNLRTTYDFEGGILNGISIGAGGRWFDKPVVAYVAPTTVGGAPVVLKGENQTFVDVNVSYKRKLSVFGRKVDWTIQLNVDNLFDNDDLVVTRVSNLGLTTGYRFNEPRDIILTNRFAF